MAAAKRLNFRTSEETAADSYRFLRRFLCFVRLRRRCRRRRRSVVVLVKRISSVANTYNNSFAQEQSLVTGLLRRNLWFFFTYLSFPQR